MSKAWAAFLKNVDRERKRLGFSPAEDCFFRGHGNASWSLLPTLLRHCRVRRLSRAQQVRALEASLYFEFRSRARELHATSISEWDILFSMRHHGLATRLLDWTTVLGVAVFFALRDATDAATPCVWVLHPYALNEISREEWDLVAPEYLLEEGHSFSDYLAESSTSAPFGWREPVAIYPVQKNMRQHAQRGFFTIHGEDLRAIDELPNHDRFLRKVPLPRAAWAGARSFLSDAGIDESLMFPDLDGLARHLHATHGIGG